MHILSSQIDRYVECFRKGDFDTAFHGLLEAGGDIIPDLIETFRAERNSSVRGFLVEVIWQRRSQSVIPFLQEALFDAEPEVWRQALDGLVALASPASLAALQVGRTREFANAREAKDYLGWLEEAIEQAKATTLQNQAQN